MKLKSFTIPILLVMLFIAGCAGATTTTSPSSTDTNTVIQKVITLGFLKDLGVITTTIDPMEGFTRFILLILLFALLFRVLDHLIGRGTAIAVSLVVSLMTVIFIPGTVLLTIATSYGTLFSLILMLVPVGLGVAAYWFLKEHPGIRAGIMGVLAFLLYNMSSYVKSFASSYVPGAPAGAEVVGGYGGVIQAVSGWINFVFWVVLVLAVWNLFSAFHSGATGHSGKFSSSLKNVALDIGKRGYKFIKNKAPRAAKAALREHIEEEKELKLLMEVEDNIEIFKKFHKVVVDLNGFEKAINKTDITHSLEAIKKSIEEAKREIKPLLRITRKQETAFNKLWKTLREKKYDLTEIEAKEKDILAKHKQCTDALEAAEGKFNSSEFKDATKFYSFKLETMNNAFPYYFVESDGRGGGPKNVVQAKQGSPPNVKDTLELALKDYNSSVDQIKNELDNAIKAEEEATKMLEGVIAETEKLLA